MYSWKGTLALSSVTTCTQTPRWAIKPWLWDMYVHIWISQLLSSYHNEQTLGSSISPYSVCRESNMVVMELHDKLIHTRFPVIESSQVSLVLSVNIQELWTQDIPKLLGHFFTWTNASFCCNLFTISAIQRQLENCLILY